jgi:hypothetical protein
MVTPWTDDDRRELAELCRVHDRMMAEARASPPVRKSDSEDELVFKVIEDATPPAPQPDAAPFDKAQVDILALVINELRDEWRRDHAAEIADLKGKLDAVAELKGKLDAVLTLLGQKEFKSAEVIDLPDWRKRDAA